MIKNLRLKFVLVFLVLVVSVIITTSCYASTYIDIPNEVILYNDLADLSAGSTTLYPPDITFTWNFNTDTHYYILLQSSNTAIKFIAIPKDTGGYYIQHPTLYANYGYDGIYVSSGGYYADYNISQGKWNCSSGGAYNHCGFIEYSDKFNWKRVIWASEDIYAVDDPTFCLYSTKPDTSFDYSFEGVKRGQTKLSIENLNTDLRMYGYVGVENTYEIGDTFISSTLSEYLRLIGINSDNSDLSCSLYEGEKLLYYIVDEYNVILDIGYISELAEGYFLYGFPVNDGVDFVFLNNGQVYWNDNLTFKYQVNNANLLTKNEVVSAGSYSYIVSSKTDAKINYTGYVYDSNSKIISTAITSTTNDLSSFYMKEVNTNYFENNVGWNKSCYWLQSIILAGTDSSGNDIDFSNYSVRWSIPTWLTVDSIEIGTSSYDKYNGVLTGFSSNGFLSIQLKIFELLKNHTNDFDITLEIYNNNGDLVLTYLVNSDDIVKNQILNNENNIDKPSYDITDNPNYTGGSNNYPGSDNIHNWGVDDFANYLGTNNTMFNFFWAFLNNMPTWISTPLTILLIGLVVITLYKFIRG